MKENFSIFHPYFSLDITLRSLYCKFKCSNMLFESSVSSITQIQLSTNSHLWVIDWKPHIEIFPRQPPCIYTIWPTRGEKLQQLHCYHPFSDSRDTYLAKNHYENYSPKMVPTNPTGSWTNYVIMNMRYTQFISYICELSGMSSYWLFVNSFAIESTKTTSMEDPSTGVLEKKKEYLRSKDKVKKWYDVSRHIISSFEELVIEGTHCLPSVKIITQLPRCWNR